MLANTFACGNLSLLTHCFPVDCHRHVTKRLLTMLSSEDVLRDVDGDCNDDDDDAESLMPQVDTESQVAGELSRGAVAVPIAFFTTTQSAIDPHLLPILHERA